MYYNVIHNVGLPTENVYYNVIHFVTNCNTLFSTWINGEYSRYRTIINNNSPHNPSHSQRPRLELSPLSGRMET